jgi:PAS domain S-box-containing protein
VTIWSFGGKRLDKIQDFLQCFENTGDGAFAIDPGQRIIFWSQTAQDLLGFTPEQAQGRFCYDLLAGRDLGDAPFCTSRCRLCEQARAGQPIQVFNLRAKNSQGQFVWINLSSVTIPDFSDGEPYGAIVHLFRLVEERGDDIPPLKIRLLGPVMVQRADGSPVDGPFRQRAKVRALFSLLALHRSQGMHRNDLIDTLWPNMDRKAKLHNLNTCVYNLRQSLEPDLEHGPDSTYIRNQGARYLLAGGRTNWLDVEKFETILAAARCEMEDCEKIRRYRQAIDLYRGEFLADLDVYLLNYWTERERYRQLYLEAMQGLGDQLVGRGREDEAANLYLKALSENPWHEATVQALMRVFINNGERSRALSIYHQFTEALNQKLEIQPTLQTKRLAEKARLQKIR